jgi:hypothetical protein
MWSLKPKAQLKEASLTNAELEIRINALEQAIIDICVGMRDHLDRIDHNTAMLDNNIQQLASMTLPVSKDMLRENKEPN